VQLSVRAPSSRCFHIKDLRHGDTSVKVLDRRTFGTEAARQIKLAAVAVDRDIFLRHR
jgi:hypothetical protein